MIRRILIVILGCVAAIVVYVIAFSIDREYQRTTELADGVTLMETIHISRSAVTTIADSGGSATIPLPYRSEWVKHQKVLRKGAVLWEGSPDKTFATSVSPDHRYFLVWDQVRSEWWRSYDLSTGNYIEIYLPVHPGMGDGMVPLRFGWWLPDSTRFYAALDGSEIEPVRQSMRYREIYLVDPANGNFYKQEHCHQLDPLNDHPPYFQPKWDTTPCAGTYQD